MSNQPLTDRIANAIADHRKQKPMKTEGGVKYPAEDYAYVPSADKPSTWKLRMSAGEPGNVTVAQLGRAAAAFSPGGFRGRKVEIPANKIAAVKSKIRAAYKKLGVKPADIPASIKEINPAGFTLWKEGDQYRWLAIYSNNYRDDDNPPEIISQAAHQDFVKAIDDGEWPYPVLRFWHIEGTDFGASNLIAYDLDSGMSVAAGTIDKEFNHVAEHLVETPDWAVSHGMPRHTIKRDETDPTVIVRYRSKEISVLPVDAAANKFTQFITVKENDMKIPDYKTEALTAAGFDVKKLQGILDDGAKNAKSEERESKEVVEEVVVEETVEEVVEALPAVEATPAPVFDPAAFATVVGGAITDALAPLVQRLDALEAPAKEKPPEQAPTTPFDTFQTLLRSQVIGAQEARVDGRKKKELAGPAETHATTPGSQIINTKNVLANNMINRIVGGDLQKEMVELYGPQQGV